MTWHSNKRSRDVAQRLAEHCKVEVTSRSPEIGDCLVWTRAKNKCGYGTIQIGGRANLVHRVAWVERHGSMPPETPQVLHHCDNPPCFRDDHLYLGTPAINGADKSARKRDPKSRQTHCLNGHEFTEANTYIPPGTKKRSCRTCRNERKRMARNLEHR